MPTTEPLAVTYLFSRSCPSHEEGLALLRRAAAGAGVAIAVEAVEVTGDAQAAALGFPGSSTYRLAGADPFPADHAGPAIADACRAYRLPGGRVGPLPDAGDLAAALRDATARAAA